MTPTPPSSRAVSLAILSIAGFSVLSCSVGPNYKRPKMDAPGSYKRVTKNDTGRGKLGRNWWRIFDDSELTRLEEATLAANQNIKAAMARVTEARMAAEIVRSAFFPTIGLNPSATRTRSALRGGSVAFAGGASSAATVNDITVPFDLNYEVDIWGAIRRNYEAAKATARASEDDLEVVLQTATSDLAQDYFNLRSFDAQVDILHHNVELFREQVELTQTQYKSGLAAHTDVLQAQSQLESTMTQEEEARRQRDDLEHAIAILTGHSPSGFSIPEKVLNPMPPNVPVGMPGSLLERRPDVAEAEENLIAANAQVGVAIAAFLPNLSLTGTAGWESSNIGQLFNWQNRLLSMGASVAQPIFEGGKLTATLKQARAKYEELVATYRQALLNAFVDVENSLADLHRRATEANSQGKAVAADKETLALVTQQYKSGLTNYLQVITTDRTLLTDEISEKQIQFNRLISTVLLIKAVGGGWKN